MPYSIVLVEDDARTRERMAWAISSRGELRLLASAGSCAEARIALRIQNPDALLLDLGLPDGDGGELIPEAVRAGARVLVLSVFADGPRQRAALAQGAQGCLLKDSSARAIGQAVAALFADVPASAGHEVM